LAETAAHAETTAETVRDEDKEDGAKKKPAASPMTAVCSLHGETMVRRQKDGDTWYSHRLPDGTWCRGAPDDQPGRRRPDAQSWERRRKYAAQFAELGIHLDLAAGGTAPPEQPPASDPGAEGGDAPDPASLPPPFHPGTTDGGRAPGTRTAQGDRHFDTDLHTPIKLLVSDAGDDVPVEPTSAGHLPRRPQPHAPPPRSKPHDERT
jgi:hypothetical protein